MDVRTEGEPFSFKGSCEVGILVMQGFTGTVGSVRYYAQQLAQRGYSVEAPRLTGHGTQWQDVNKARYQDWIKDAERGYQMLATQCDKVFVTGLSMGGTLVLYLAEQHPELAGVMPINAPVFMNDKRIFLLPVLKHMIASTPAIASDIMEPGVVEPAYDRTPTAGTHEMVKLLSIVRSNLVKVGQPLLVMRSAHDHVVPHECGQFIMDHVSSRQKELVVFERSAHVVTMDYDKDAVVETAQRFIQRFAS